MERRHPPVPHIPGCLILTCRKCPRKNKWTLRKSQRLVPTGQSRGEHHTVTQSAETAHYLRSHYAQKIAALSIGNEVDYHTAHSYCTDGRACACIAGKGCSCLPSDPLCMKRHAGQAALPALIIHDPEMYEVSISQAMTNAGNAFPSYLDEWRKYIGVITAVPGLKHAPVAGPDAFSYTTGARFTGRVCGSSFTSTAWPQLLAVCEKNDPKINFLVSYGHYYVGGNIANGR